MQSLKINDNYTFKFKKLDQKLPFENSSKTVSWSYADLETPDSTAFVKETILNTSPFVKETILNTTTILKVFDISMSFTHPTQFQIKT